MKVSEHVLLCMYLFEITIVTNTYWIEAELILRSICLIEANEQLIFV